jgi:GTPase SAR1 family protein
MIRLQRFSASLLLLTDVQASLKVVEMWFQRIRIEEGAAKPIVYALAGTKMDLPESDRKVSEEKVHEFVKHWGIDIYVETSSKENTNVDDLFQEIAETLLARFGKE